MSVKPAPGHLPPPPKIKIKKTDGSLLSVAEKKAQEEVKSREDPPPKKLAHVYLNFLKKFNSQIIKKM